MNPNENTPEIPVVPEAPVVTPGVNPVANQALVEPAVASPATDPVVASPVVDSAMMGLAASPAAMNPATMATPEVSPAEQPAASIFEPSVTTPTASATPSMSTAPAETVTGAPATSEMPVFDPEMLNFGATDPITMPEGPKAPDPIEEELKMPLKAADPVPGSIGSAVSVPSVAGQSVTGVTPNTMRQTPSVAFNDPAASVAQGTPDNKPAKKKTSKSTLVIAGVLGVVVIVALVIVLVMQLMK